MQKTAPPIISPPNVENRSLFIHDNLPVLRSMDGDTVDLIYLDPPFNTGRQWENPIEAKGKKAIASFEDTWRLDDIHTDEYYALVSDYPDAAHIIDALQKVNGDSWKAYLIYMGVRLAELHRILKETGSIYFHCDPTMSHGVKLLMDSIFGKKNCRNEIIWQRNDGRAKGSQYQSAKFGSNTDTILFYGKSKLHIPKVTKDSDPHDPEIIKKFNKQDIDGRKYYTGIPLFCSKSMGARPNLCYSWRGYKNPHPSGWRLSKKRLEEEYEKGNVVIKDGKIERRKYFDDYDGKPMDNNWTDISRLGYDGESTGYPTQKPLALLERIIKASSNEGDVVLDPFCGCATTCVAAEMLKRQWIGIDLSENAADIIHQRLRDIVNHPLADPKAAVNKVTVKNQSDLPKRTDLPKYDRDKTRIRLLKLYGNKCACCQKTFQDIRLLESDHIIAKSRGGQDVEENIQLLCVPCNKDKGGGGMEAARRKMQERLMREKMEAAREDWWKEREVVYKSANKKESKEL